MATVLPLMRRAALLMLAAPLLLVSCISTPSGETGLADDGEPAEVVSDEAALERQYSYLEDEVLTDEEYEAAFAAFMECANRRGAHVEIRGVDPESGQILYEMWYEGREVGEACYENHFRWVDSWFQTTNPVMLRQEINRLKDEWTRYVVPCLERFGTAVPAHLDGTENTKENHEAMPFYEQYIEHLEAGSCE